jgi:RNA polymerase-binding transcription factor DksA
MSEQVKKTRYSDHELQEFKELINAKIAIAREELATLAAALNVSNTNGTDDTGVTHQTLEDGAATLERESINQLAVRQRRFIDQLELALIRIGNKTYGVCRETGNLIRKERLMAVPHTTLSMSAKMKQY